MIVLALTTVAVSSAILLQVAELSGFLHTHGHTIPSLGGAVDSVSAGSPQTILMLGSDRRYADTKLGPAPLGHDHPRAAGPRQGRTALMSLPRDLKVDDPRARRRTRSTPPTRSAGRR